MAVFVSIAGVLVAAAAAYIAWAQFVLARRKTRWELFEKRYELYDLLWGYLSALANDSTRVEELDTQMANVSSKFFFLFDEAVFQYVEDIRRRAIEQKVLRESLRSTDPTRAEAAAKALIANTSAFKADVDGLRIRFAKYLHFQVWSGLPDWAKVVRRWWKHTVRSS